MRTKTFYIHIPGNFYPLSFEATSERDARAQYREWANLSRMPSGSEVWCVSEREKRYVTENYRQHQADLPGWARGPL